MCMNQTLCFCLTSMQITSFEFCVQVFRKGGPPQRVDCSMDNQREMFFQRRSWRIAQFSNCNLSITNPTLHRLNYRRHNIGS